VAGFVAAGEVVALGDAVAAPALGATVVSAGAGAFAEYMVVPAAAAVPAPTGWSAEQALGLAINWPTALAALTLGRLSAGETVLIHAAAGATGQAALTLARHRGARVIGAASAHKRDVVHAAGADHVLDARDPDLAASVLELTGGRGADLVIESAGGASFDASLAATRRVTGRLVVLGLAGGNAAVGTWDLVYRHPVQIIGFNLGALFRTAPSIVGQVMGELAALIAAGVVGRARPTTYPLADGARALVDLERRATVGKLALLP
jgi:NADPH2:quinone reductase